MTAFEKTKRALQRVKSQNKNLKQRLNDQSITFTDYQEEEDEKEESEGESPNDENKKSK